MRGERAKIQSVELPGLHTLGKDVFLPQIALGGGK